MFFIRAFCRCIKIVFFRFCFSLFFCFWVRTECYIKLFSGYSYSITGSGKLLSRDCSSLCKGYGFLHPPISSPMYQVSGFCSFGIYYLGFYFNLVPCDVLDLINLSLETLLSLSKQNVHYFIH